MMKRTRIDEVQFGTRTGPVPGAAGVGGPGGNSATSTVGVNTAGGVTIGTVVPNAHSGIGSIHHRILTPQHGGAQTIAYLPSTTPTAATNLKTTSHVDSASTGAQTNVSAVPGGVVVSTGSAATQTLQYTTSYSVASIQAGGTLKANSADGNAVQIHVAPGSATATGASQTVSSSCQTGTLRQRTISGTSNTVNASTGIGSMTSTSQQTTAVQQTPPNGPATAGNSTPPQGQAAGGIGGGIGGSAAPRLKVEDALSYLDQVKYQYADQPQIYNNFLDIMKEFKSHCIDTPGVIERVSTLFKGHTELIYGFNMFLPPGYKIEIHSDALGCSVPVVSMPSPPGAPSSTGTVHMIAANNNPLTHTTLKTLPLTGNAGTVGTGGSATPGAAVAQIQTAGAVNLMTHGGASLTQTTIHALQPTTGAASQSPGGAGHVHVTSSSGAPPGLGVGVSVSAHSMPQNYSRDRGEQRATITPAGSAQVGVAGGAVVAPAAANIVVGGGPPTPNSLSELSPHGGPAAAQHNLHHIQQAHQSILLGETTGQQNQPVEFNHAITYVNKIKNRFQSQPAKYKKFLEILHAYQKEQKVMKEGSGSSGGLNQGKMLTEQEVYTQVAKLFGQDEDLLREFGQFLPDATNHQSSAVAAAQYMSKSGLHNDHHNKQQQRTTTTATLSGGAHISMSSASPSTALPNSGSPLHLSSGATLSQIDSTSVHAHAAAIGNLSAVNTSVSIKACGVQQNHIISSSSGASTGGIFDKDFHALSQQQMQQQQQHRGVHPHLSNVPTAIRAGIGTLLDQRNNHHAQKYAAQHPHQNISQKKSSPSYGGISGGSTTIMSHHHQLNENSLDLNSPNITNYVSPAQLPTHTLPHHNAHNSNTSSGIGATSRRQAAEDLAAKVASATASAGTLIGTGCAANVGGPPPAKRSKPYCRDVSFSEASRKCTIADAAFFDKVRKALRSPEVYENFLRCLTLFNQEVVSKTELLALVSPFLMKFPDLLRWFTDFLGPPTSGQTSGSAGTTGGIIDGMPLAGTQRQSSNSSSHERASSHQSTDYVQDIDLSLCKRLGASYCALPQSTVPKKCSGRTALCREVLNDKWVSFPTWASEDSTFVTSRKTQFEETIYRTEDERFELDLVIEVNSATIRVLENVQKKMSRMSPEELAKYHLDDHLGGTSQTIHQRAIHRIYGDKSGEIIQGMKKNPSVAVPIVLKRLKVKEEEWRDAQKGFNKQWREQNEKYYLKSLDHQAINFKPNDMKALRSKSLFNEIETLYDERHDQEDDAMEAAGPHLVLPYKDKTILDDAANLLIHHVKRQTGIQKQEKQKIKQIIRQFVPDLFFAPRQPLSDDERDDAFQFLVDDTKMDVDSPALVNRSAPKGIGTPSSEAASPARSNASSSSGSGVTAVKVIKKESVDDAAKSLPATTAAIGTADDATPSTSAAAAAATATGDLKDKPEAGEETTISVSNNNLTTDSPRRTAEDAATAAASATTAGSGDASVKQEQSGDFVNPVLLPAHAQGQREDESYSLFFANNNWYLFLRLHAILCDRLHVMYERARLLAIEEERCRVNRRESTATALRLKPKPDVQVEDYYPTFLDMLKNVLDGNMDSNTFEDTMREMFGIYAYVSFTLDKVVSNAVRQLQYCVTERAALDCVELFAGEQRRGSTGGNCRDAHKSYDREMSYQRKAESILNEENCFKVYIYKIDCRVTIELLDSEPEEVEKPTVLKAQKFSKYVERLANPAMGVSGGSGIGGGGGGGSSNTNNNAANSNDAMETSDIKAEEEEENSGLVRGTRKARFLLRNKRKSQLHEEQVRQWLEQKRSSNCNEANVNAVTVDSTSVNANNSSSNNNNNINNNNNNNSWNKRAPLERLGAPQLGIAEQYAFNDRDEISTNPSNGRCFVTSKNLNLLKYDAVRRAKNSHCRVTQSKFKRFQSYVNKWLQQHVSEQLQQNCSDWLLGKTPEQINASGWGATSKTKSMQQKDTSKTPYRIYTRYKVLHSGNSSSNISNATTVTTAGPAVTAGVGTTAASMPATVAGSAAVVPLAATSTHSLGTSNANSSSLDTTAAATTTAQQHCNSAAAAAAAATAGSNTETTLQQVRPIES